MARGGNLQRTATPAVRSKPRRSTQQSSKKLKAKLANVYEVAAEEAESEKPELKGPKGSRKRTRLDPVESYEYELPEDFEDEEIDEDTAFNADDEEKYGLIPTPSSSKSKKQNGKPSNTHASDDEDNDENDDGDDEDDEQSMQLSDMLSSDPSKMAFEKLKPRSVTDIDDHGDNEFDTNDIEDENDHENNEELDDLAHNGLLSFVTSLANRDSNKRKRSERSQEVTESRQEGEFNVNAAAAPTNGRSALSSLVGSLEGTTGFAALKKQLSKLDAKSTVLTAPLPLRAQEKVNRQAATQQTNLALDKWQPIVQHNRKAEHLEFPLNAPKPVIVTNASIAARFEPTSELEREVSAILQESGTQTEKSLAEFEEMALKDVPLEEIEKRRAELIRQRNLLFYHEQKAKRISKIKSKAYHKILKKEREKRSLTDSELAELDPRAHQAKVEERRALERMTLRHKSGGRFARDLAKRPHDNPESRKARLRQLAIGEELRRKINNYDAHADSDSDKDDDQGDDDDHDDDEEENEDSPEKQLKEIEEEEAAFLSNKDDGLELPDKGLFALKFMQRGLAKKKDQARQMLQDLQKELEESDDVPKSNQTSLGRRVIGPVKGQKQPKAKKKNQAANKKADSKEEDDDDADDSHDDDEEEEEEDNAQINATSKDKPLFNRKARETHSQKGPSAPDANKIVDKAAVANARDKENGIDNEKEDEDEEEVIDAAEFSLGMTHLSRQSAEAESVITPFVMNQKDLIAQAFAADNVLIEDFEKEKAELTEESRPKDIDVTLPGWGAWGGEGAKPMKRRFIKPAPKDEPPRADAKLKHVIINEKRNRKAAKFLVNKVPHPFQTREQYERSLQQPVGPEWNSTNTFQKAIKPRVLVRQGSVIQPLKFTKQPIDDDKAKSASKNVPIAKRNKRKPLS